jgi:glycosyltransferase involved in cell wall biosynthesis
MALRIAHLTATFPPYPGGAGNTAYRFARGQAERGHHVEVFTAPASGEPPDPGDVIVHRIEPLLAIGNAPLIPSIAAFDVLHLHYPFIFGAELTLLGRITRRRRRQALVIHYKNRLLGRGVRAPLFAAYERTVSPVLVRAADRVLVLSPDHAGSVPYLRGLAASRPERVVAMPNGVDVELFAPRSGGRRDLRHRLGVAADALLIAFVATLDRAHHFKRLDVAIDAIARLDGALPPHLVVAGGGELLEGYREQARAAGVSERVHFLGAVPHAALPAVLRAADLFLLATEPPESFGIALAEAMACGLPAIATDYPGVRAVVDDEATGLLVPPGDAAAVAAAIERLSAAGPEGRTRMGAAGRAKAEREWSWSALIDRMDAAYAEAIEERRRRL